MRRERRNKAMKSKLSTVLAYEFKKIVCKKSFIIVTILGPFLMAALILIPSLSSLSSVDRSGETISIGILSDGNNLTYAVRDSLAASGWNIVDKSDEESLKSAVFNKSIEGYLVRDGKGSFGYYSDDTGDLYVHSALENVVSNVIISDRLAKQGLDPQMVFSMMEATSLPSYKLSQKENSAEESDSEGSYLVKLLVPLFFAMTIYMAILLYGQSIGRSVVSEKSSKIVDVLLSSVRPDDLLMGKIFGVALSGVLQFSIWIGFALVGVSLFSKFTGFTIPVQLSPLNFVYLGVFFLLGFLLFGACYGAVGAASEDEQHMGQLSYPFLLCLIVPICFISSISSNPNSALAVFLSLFPFTSPMVMLTRLVGGQVPIWQLAISIVLLVGSIYLVMKLAAKIFRVGILLTGKNFKFADMKSWLMEK